MFAIVENIWFKGSVLKLWKHEVTVASQAVAQLTNIIVFVEQIIY